MGRSSDSSGQSGELISRVSTPTTTTTATTSCSCSCQESHLNEGIHMLPLAAVCSVIYNHSNSCSSTQTSRLLRPMTTLPAPTPRSPPRYPDLYGKHRKQAELQVLNREIGFLEEELQSLEGLQPASRCCKEVDDFVVTNPDPLIPLNQKFHRSFRICKWLRMKSCFNLSWLCCFSGCTFHLKWPACMCDPARYCKCCCRLPDCCHLPDCFRLPDCRSLPHCCRCRCRCRCHCRPCCCSCSCLEKCWTSCCILPRLSCPDCSCSCEWSCPKCTKVCCCPKCTKVCCYPKCTRNCCIPCCLCF